MISDIPIQISSNPRPDTTPRVMPELINRPIGEKVSR
jgi:hypothetical protein